MRLPGSNNYLSYLLCCIFIALLLLNYSDAKRRHEEEEEEEEEEEGSPDAQFIIPYQTCGTHRICDRRSQYCDEVVGDCVSCADDCHPARIRGDAVATSDCNALCPLYYRQMITSTGIRGHDIVAVADDDDGDDDDDDDDVVARTTKGDDDDADASCERSLSRRKLRLLIELELLKLQSRTTMEIMFCAMILTLLVIGFIWLRSFGHSKTGALVIDASGM